MRELKIFSFNVVTLIQGLNFMVVWACTGLAGAFLMKQNTQVFGISSSFIY